MFLALKLFLSLLRGFHVLVRMDSMSVVSYLNHQGGLCSRPLCRLARQILRAVHILVPLNLGADLVSRQRLETGEWRLHPQVVSLIWQKFGRVEVDLFVEQDHSLSALVFPVPPIIYSQRVCAFRRGILWVTPSGFLVPAGSERA